MELLERIDTVITQKHGSRNDYVCDILLIDCKVEIGAQAMRISDLEHEVELLKDCCECHNEDN